MLFGSSSVARTSIGDDSATVVSCSLGIHSIFRKFPMVVALLDSIELLLLLRVACSLVEKVDHRFKKLRWPHHVTR